MPPISPSVLQRVARLVDQQTRVACCLCSKYAYDALLQPGVWRRVTVHSPTDAAWRFVHRMGVAAVHLEFENDDVKRLEWFLETLPTHIEALYITLDDISWVKTNVVTEWISELTSLRHLTLDCRRVSRPTCICIPTLPELFFLRVTEHGHPGRLEVYFDDDAQLPQLEQVHLEVHTSDILSHAPRMRRLRSITYLGEKESFEDAQLRDKRLDALMVRVASNDAMEFLTNELARARHVERLTLVCAYEGVRVEMYVPARHLSIRIEESTEHLAILFPVVRDVDSLSIHPHTLLSHTPWCVRFYSVGSWYNFQRWMQKSTLEVGFEGTVVVDPM